MNNQQPEVWESEHSIDLNAAPETVWALFKDVRGWTQWNAGVVKVELDGPFETGTYFEMSLSGGESIVTRLVEVRENAGFLDETRLGELRIFVDHRIEALAPGRCRIVFSLEAFGPSCEEIGAGISADFPNVLKALASLAECDACQNTG